MKINDETILFSSGKRAFANNGTVGLSPRFEISQGYSGNIHVDYDTPLSALEKLELADYMIAQWTKFNESV